MRIKNWAAATLTGILLTMSACSEGGGGENKADRNYSQGNYEEAISAYSKTLDTKPKNFHALYNRGRSYEELGEFGKAEKDFLAALEIEPRNTQVLLSLSNIFQKQKNHNSALLYAEQATEVAGAPAQAYFMKARALHQMGNTQEAMREYTAAVSIDKNYGQAYYYRGLLKLATNNKRGACEDIRTAIKLNHSEAQDALEKYCN